MRRRSNQHQLSYLDDDPVLARWSWTMVGLEDLIAVHTAPCPLAPILAKHIDAITPTFSPGTAATYRSYWRQAIAHLGDRRLTDITVVDLRVVVGSGPDDAGAGWRAIR